MVSLRDLICDPAPVTVRGRQIPVCGLSAESIGILLGRFPPVARALSGQGWEVGAADLQALGQEVVSAVIAAGVGKPGDAEEEAAARRLALGDQLALLAAVLEATLPEGVGPFLRSLEALGFRSASPRPSANGADAGASTRDPAMARDVTPGPATRDTSSPPPPKS